MRNRERRKEERKKEGGGTEKRVKAYKLRRQGQRGFSYGPYFSGALGLIKLIILSAIVLFISARKRSNSLNNKNHLAVKDSKKNYLNLCQQCLFCSHVGSVDNY